VENGSSDFEVVTEVYGEVSGRLRRDGVIDIVVETGRKKDLTSTVRKWKSRRRLGGSSGIRGSGGTRGSGRKEFSLTTDEAVRIKLPDATGRSYQETTPGSARLQNLRQLSMDQAVGVFEGWVVVDWAMFFEGHETTLVITATPER
jgi:hypothetical protein